MESIDPRKFAAAESIEEVHSLLAAAGIGPGWNNVEPSLWLASAQGARVRLSHVMRRSRTSRS
jgi:hypothetical protein